MRPGITGLAQVERRNSATWDERIEIDVQYVEQFNILLDIIRFLIYIHFGNYWATGSPNSDVNFYNKVQLK